MGKFTRFTGRNICNFYSYSQGRCCPIDFERAIPVELDVSECPVIKAGKRCSNFQYRGDQYGAIDDAQKTQPQTS